MRNPTKQASRTIAIAKFGNYNFVWYSDKNSHMLFSFYIIASDCGGTTAISPFFEFYQ